MKQCLPKLQIKHRSEERGRTSQQINPAFKQSRIFFLYKVAPLIPWHINVLPGTLGAMRRQDFAVTLGCTSDMEWGGGGGMPLNTILCSGQAHTSPTSHHHKITRPKMSTALLWQNLALTSHLYTDKGLQPWERIRNSLVFTEQHF